AHVVLTGGTMGEAVLAAVGEHEDRDTVDWSRITFWWGDERYLPRGHDDRNETQSRRALLDALGLPAERIKAFPAVGEHATIEEDRKSTRLNSSHVKISYAVFCL